MRKTLIMAVGGLLLVAAVMVAVLSGHIFRAAANGIGGAANLPVVLKPENTPTPTVTPTVAPTVTATPTIVPTPYSTLVPQPSPTPGFGLNALENGSFENGWTDLPPVEGFLINQNPNGWELDWLEKGEEVWDLRTMNPQDPNVGIVNGIAEMIHKLKTQLPPEEQLGGPKALILEGEVTYKMFHRAAAFGSQLYQEVTMSPGTYRLTVPVQLHWHEDLDPDDPTWDTFTAESGAWVLADSMQAGGWATARDMGDRRWFYHVIEFSLSAETKIGILIRVKSIYPSPKDFFIDAVWLEEISANAYQTNLNSQFEAGRMVSWPRPLDTIPVGEIVTP